MVPAPVPRPRPNVSGRRWPLRRDNSSQPRETKRGLHVSTFCWLDASYQEVQGDLVVVRDRKHLVEIPAPLTMQFSAEGLRLDSKRVS